MLLKMFKNLVLNLILFYKNWLSFDGGLFSFVAGSGGVCRHSPTCSTYAYLSVKRLGVFKGMIVAFRRVFTCGPWI